MISHVAKHEIRRYLRDGRSRALLLAVLVMLVASLAFSFRNYQLASHQYEQNQKQLRANWEQQSQKDPHDAAHDGTYVIKPLHPLSVIDRGIQPYTGKVVHLGAHQRKQSTLNEAKDHAGAFRFGELTPSFLVTYLIPLLLVLLGFSAFTEENEKRTLRLLLVQGVTRRELALGKWLALFMQAAVLWLVVFLATLLVSLILDDQTMISFAEVLTLSGVYLLYFSIFVSLIIWVSSKASSSGSALTILITTWIVFALVVPKVSTNLAGWIYPFPTLQTFQNNINQDQESGLNGHNFWNEAAKDFEREVLSEYGVETVEELPVEFGGLLLAEGEKYESEIYTKHFDLLQNQYKKQRAVYQWSSLFSPMLPVRFISMGISRTDYGFLWRFEDQAEEYRVEFNTALNMDIARNAKGIEQYTAGKELWEGISEFSYQWQQGQEVLRGHIFEIAATFFWAAISFFIAIFYCRKLDVA